MLVLRKICSATIGDFDAGFTPVYMPLFFNNKPAGQPLIIY